MRKLVLLVGILMIAFLGFAAVAAAQEGSVFGNGVLLRAYVECSSACDGSSPLYSAYLEVRDEEGNIITDLSDFRVTGVQETMTPEVTANPFKIHDNDLVNNDISISYDYVTKNVYVFCTDMGDGLHVMKYDISLTTPVNGACVTYSTGLTQKPEDLCLAGDPSVVAGSGPWSWICNGLNGGQPADCSAQLKVNGACGLSHGGTFPTIPTSNLCNAGTASGVSGTVQWNWTCSGLNGGTPASCSAAIEATGNTIDLDLISISGATGVTYSALWNTKVVVKNLSTNRAGAFYVKFYNGNSTTPIKTEFVSAGLAGGAEMSVYSSMYLYLPAHVWMTIRVVIEPNASDTDTVPSNNTSPPYRSVSGV